MGRVLWGAPAPNFLGVCLPTINELFDHAIKRIEANEIRSIALIMVDVNGRVSTNTVAEGEQKLGLLGALDVSKRCLRDEITNGAATG